MAARPSTRRRSGWQPLTVAPLLQPSACVCANDIAKQIGKPPDRAEKLRATSTRAFDTGDKNLTVRNVIATLQDLGFVVGKADETLGTVSGTRFDGSVMRMTITVRPRGKDQVAVRASGQYRMDAISDPRPCQQFFEALSKAMFLTAHEIDQWSDANRTICLHQGTDTRPDGLQNRIRAPAMKLGPGVW